MGWEEFGALLGDMGKYVTVVNPYPLSPSQEEINTAVTINNRAATRQAIINAVRKGERTFYERSQWSLRTPPNPNDIVGTVPRNPNLQFDWDYTMIAIHHAGGSYQCSTDFGNMRRVEDKHIDDNEWVDIGYHYAIDCSGNIYEARDIRFKGAHLERYNTGAIGIVLLENLSGVDEKGTLYHLHDWLTNRQIQPVPDLQQASLKALIIILMQYFNINILGGHREFPKQNRSCPGNMGIITVNSLRHALNLQAPQK